MVAGKGTWFSLKAGGNLTVLISLFPEELHSRENRMSHGTQNAAATLIRVFSLIPLLAGDASLCNAKNVRAKLHGVKYEGS